MRQPIKDVRLKLAKMVDAEDNCYYCRYKLSHPEPNPHIMRQAQIAILKWILGVEK
jgi:hypothetical protein